MRSLLSSLCMCLGPSVMVTLLIIYLMRGGVPDEQSLHFLSALRGELAQLASREVCEMGEEDYGEDFLGEANARLSSENELVRSLAIKCSELVSSYEAESRQHQASINNLAEELEERTIASENLQEIVAHLERKVQGYQEEWEKLRNDLIHLSQSHERLQANCAQLRTQLLSAQREAEAATERQRLTALTIASEKHILLDQIRTERTANAELSEQMRQAQARSAQLEREWRSQGARLAELQKYSRQMENILNEKNETISRLEAELQTAKQQNHTLPHQDYPEHQMSTYFTAVDEDPERHTPSKLEEELPCELQQHGLGLLFPTSVRLLQDSPTVRMGMDPYFSHFVLTSQSVKIKEDCEELLNIDAKPFYPEIVEKRIPMHLWDQWIRNKLMQELRLRAGSEHEDGQD